MIPSAEELTQLSHMIYKRNLKVGWWQEDRSGRDLSTVICLLHSEISEAMEGHRKELMDDHLPHHPMFDVEIADLLIRALDVAGSLDIDFSHAEAMFKHHDIPDTKLKWLSEAHQMVSTIASYEELAGTDKIGQSVKIDEHSWQILQGLIWAQYMICDHYKIPIGDILMEKWAYNAQRADHKKENRDKQNGKKF